MEANSAGEKRELPKQSLEVAKVRADLLEEPKSAWGSIETQKGEDVVDVQDMHGEVFETLDSLGQLAAQEEIPLAFGGSFAKRSLGVQEKDYAVRDYDGYTTKAGVFRLAELFQGNSNIQIVETPDENRPISTYGDSYRLTLEVTYKDEAGENQIKEIEVWGSDEGGTVQMGNMDVRKNLVETKYSGKDGKEMTLNLLSQKDLLGQYLVVAAGELHKLKEQMKNVRESASPEEEQKLKDEFKNKWAERFVTMWQLMRKDATIAKDVPENLENYKSIGKYADEIKELKQMLTSAQETCANVSKRDVKGLDKDQTDIALGLLEKLATIDGTKVDFVVLRKEFSFMELPNINLNNLDDENLKKIYNSLSHVLHNVVQQEKPTSEEKLCLAVIADVVQTMIDNNKQFIPANSPEAIKLVYFLKIRDFCTSEVKK